MTMRWLAISVLTACTGLSLGENTPGGDNWVDPPPAAEGQHTVGAIAVEPDEDQLWVVHEEQVGGVVRAALAAIDPETGATQDVADVSGATDRRVMFASADRMLLMAQQGGTESLTLFDTTTRRPIAATTKPTWYWGTRTAPSGRAVVVADNADAKAPLHLIDLATLAHQVLPHDGDDIEAMWNHAGDVLLAVSVKLLPDGTPTAKLLRYDLTAHDFAAPLPSPSIVWQLDGYGWDGLFSFTWIGISPDDHWAVFPLIKHTPGTPATQEHVLLVLDQTTGHVTLAPGRGPVGFTRDSARIISYGTRAVDEETSVEDLWLIDPATRERTTVQTMFGLLSFAPLRQSDHVLVSTALFEDVPLGILDTTTLTLRETSLRGASLRNYVTRSGHAWLITGGALQDVDVATGSVTRVSTIRPPGSINIRPSKDQAIITATDEPRLYRYDMITRRLMGASIPLPRPSAKRAPVTARRALQPRSPRLLSRAAHDGDAISLERR